MSDISLWALFLKSARMTLLSCAVMLVSVPVFAENQRIQVVDGLGRPLAQVSVVLEKLMQKSGGGIRLQKLAVFTSDANGGVTLRGAASHHLSERDLVRYKGGFLQLVFSKPGYAGFSTFSPESVEVLKREFRLEDLDRIASLRGPAQVRELREILGGEIKGDQRAFDTQIFQQASLFRSSLLERVKDPKSRAAAGQLLAMIGMPED